MSSRCQQGDGILQSAIRNLLSFIIISFHFVITKNSFGTWHMDHRRPISATLTLEALKVLLVMWNIYVRIVLMSFSFLTTCVALKAKRLVVVLHLI
jgi:hypothetical protein